MSNSRATGGLVVFNDVRGEVEGFINNTLVDAGGDVSVQAIENATLLSTAESNVTSSGGSAWGTGDSVAKNGQIVSNVVLSKANAFNTVGWKAQNIFFAAADAFISGDPVVSGLFEGAEPAELQAYIQNSDVDVAGDISVTATGQALLNATTTNAAESAAGALVNAGGKAMGGILSSNKVNSFTKAFIDNSGAVSGQEINAGGNITIAGSDDAGVFANTKLVSASSTTNDGGAAVLQETLNDIAILADYRTDGATSQLRDLDFGDLVRLDNGFPDDRGNPGSVYQYMGDSTDGLGTDLAAEDFTNLDFWKEFILTQLVPQGRNITGSDSIAYGVLIVYNDVRSEVDAYIQDATVAATNRSMVDANAISNTSTGDTGVGLLLAFNSVGYLPANSLFNFIEALIGDPTVSTVLEREVPAEIEAFIQNSTVDAEGVLSVSAVTPTPDSDFTTSSGVVSRLVEGNTVGDGPRGGVYRFLAPDRDKHSLDGDEFDVDLGAEDYLDTERWELVGTITARTSNAATSAASAFKGATGAAFGGIVTTNRVSTSARAYIALSDFTTEDGSRRINDGDRVQDTSDGTVYEYSGSQDVIDLGNEDFTTGSWSAVVVSNDVNADLGVTIVSDDNATIAADNLLVAESQTVNDGGASLLTDFLETLANEYQFTNKSGLQTVVTGSKVLVGSSPVGGAQTCDLYIYRPLLDPMDPLSIDDRSVEIDLDTEDFAANPDWVLVDPLDLEALIPDGINLNTTKSDSTAVGGVIVLNDVRGEAASFIDDTTLTATNGGVSLTTTEDAIIIATNESTASADGGSFFVKGGTTFAANIMIATNAILSSANAYITDSTLGTADTPLGGDVIIDADNTSIIEAITDAQTTAEGAGESVALGLTLAFNRMGVKSILLDLIDVVTQQAEITQDALDQIIKIPWFDIDATNFSAEEPTEVQAHVMDSSLEAAGGLTQTATADESIDAIVAAGSVAIAVSGVGGGSAAGSGADAVNKIANGVRSFIGGDGATGIIADSVTLTAVDTSTINAFTGAASIAASAGIFGGDVALAISFSENQISNEVEASISNVDNLIAREGDVTLLADELAGISAQTIAASLAVTIAIGGSFSGAGAESTNTIANAIQAFIADSGHVTAEGAVTVSAQSMDSVSADIDAIAASVGLVSGAVGGSVSTSTISETTSAFIENSTVTALGGDIIVQADSMPTVDTTTRAVAFATGISAAAAVASSKINSTTQAYIDTGVLTAIGNDVIVDATFVSSMDPENLGAAVGLTGIAGISSQATIAGTTQAFADGATIIKANSLDISADDTNTASPSSLAVGIGDTGVGGAGVVSTTDITRTTEAFIGSGADIDTGTGTVNLTAESASTAAGDATGVGVGGTVGVAALVVDVTVDTTTRAYVDDGATVAAGQLNLLADATNDLNEPKNDPDFPDATFVAVGVGGLAGISVMDVVTTDSSTVEAYIGSGTGTPATVNITNGGVDVQAQATSDVRVDSVVAAFSIGVAGAATLAQVNATPTVRTYMGEDASITADGDVSFDAAAQVEGAANMIGFGASVGGSVVGVDVETNVNPTIQSFTEGGGSITADNITFTSRHNVDASGDALSVTPASGEATLGSVALGAGIAGVDITVENSPVIETAVGSGTTVNASGAVSLASQSFQLAELDGFTASIGLVGVGITLPESIAERTVSTHFDGVLESAQTVSIVSDVDAQSNTQGLGAAIGAVGITAADVVARTSPTIGTFVGSTGDITATGDVTIESIVQTQSEATTKAVAGGIGAVSTVDTTATAAPQIDTYVASGGSVTSTSGNVGLSSAHNFDTDFVGTNTVRAAVESVVGGGLAVADGTVTANALADVDTRTASGSSIQALAGDVTLEARSGNFADGTIENDSGGAFTVSFLNPTANANGITRARLLGNVGSVETVVNVFGESETVGISGAANVSVVAQAADRSTADFDNNSSGAVTVDAPSTARATSNPDIFAQVGSFGGTVVATGNVTVDAGSNTDADATAKSSGSGGLNISDFNTVAVATPDVDAVAGANAYVEAGGLLTLSATHGGTPDAQPDGTFTSLNVNDTANTVTFSQAHGLITGDSVTYDAPPLGTVTDPNPNNIGGIFDGRDYDVVTDDPNVLQLGSQFDESAIDLVNDTITIAGHSFEDGDQVLYQLTSGATGATGLGVGTFYTVKVIDVNTIKLIDPAETVVERTFDPTELINRDNDDGTTPETPLVENNQRSTLSVTALLITRRSPTPRRRRWNSRPIWWTSTS